MASQKKATKGTLLGFFQKVDGPSRSSPTASRPQAAAFHATPKTQAAASSSKPSTPASGSAVSKQTFATSKAGLPSSPPASVSNGSVSPSASTSLQQSRTSIGTPSSPDYVNRPNPFKTPGKPSPASRQSFAVDPRSGLPTPPVSSPLQAEEDEDDDDEEDVMPSISRRAAASKKRQNYFESGSESEGGSDFEADDSDASPPPRVPSRQAPPAKKSRPSTSTANTQARPPFARASTSATSAEKRSPPFRGSFDTPNPTKSTSFSFLNDRRDMDKNRPNDPDFDPRTLYIPSSAWDDMTNFEKQYFEIKQWNMDTILMFQKGKFYEMFLEDSEIVHRELDLKLTDRGRMPMVGVPEASFDMFATKLLALGYKVGRVDQMETAVAKGMRAKKGSSSEIVRRELRHVMTTGTMIEGLEDDLASYCIALSENVVQQGGEDFATFGVCMLDAATSEFTLAQWQDDRARSELETLLRSHRVKEIIHKKGQISKETLRIIKNCVGADCRITMLREGKEWLTPDDTVSELTNLFGSEDDVPEAISSVLDKDEVVSAMGGMFAYLTQLSLLSDVASSRNFQMLEKRRKASGQPMKLDANTLSHLCVLRNEDGSDTGTLHRLLNRCVTPSGKRLFQVWLTHPLSDAASIDARLDAVDDMMGNVDFEDAFVPIKKFPDFERLIPKVASGKIKPVDFTGLLTALKRLTPFVDSLRDVAGGFKSTLIKNLLSSIPDVASLAQELDAMFKAEEDGSFKPHPGVDEDYDAGQAQVEEVEEQLETELRRIRKKLGLGSQKTGGCNWKHRGTNEIYQIEVPAKTKVPDDWMQISSTNSGRAYYNPLVKGLVLSLKEARETRLAALKAFHSGLFQKFNEHAGVYMTAVRAIAQVDCLLSLAQASYAMGEPTCRPTFVEHERALVDFEGLRHPCIASTTDFIANDIAMGGDEAEVILLTGGNMAGKSTTARTTATAVILAQLGCRVPAKSARISPVDRICSRMGANDQIFRNSSTFMVEMQEASRIIKECTPRSLVIMDELGRGTSTFDGHAIAHAVLHHLIARTRCLSFFLTHYLQLAYDFQGYPRCSNKHMEVLVDDEHREVVFTYRIVDGVAESSYGTQVAGLAGVPRDICDRANDISEEFAEATKREQAERTTSTVPMSTLSDFAYLFKLGQGSVSDNSAQIASQLEVIRAQVERVESSSGIGGGQEDVVMSDAPESPSVDTCHNAKETMDQTPTRSQLRSTPRSSSSASSASTVRAGQGSYGGANGRKRRRTDTVLMDEDPSDNEGAIGKRTLSSGDSSPPSSPTPRNRKHNPPVVLEERPATKLNCPSRTGSSSNNGSGTGAKEQMILQLGQKIQITCRECGMSYDRSSAQDSALHVKYHERILRGIDWSSANLQAAGEVVSIEGCQGFTLSEDVVVKALGKSLIQKSHSNSAGNAASISGRRQGSTLDVDLDAMLSPSHRKSHRQTIPVKFLRYALTSRARDQFITRKILEVESTIDEALGASPLPDSTREESKLYIAVLCGRVISAAIVGKVPLGEARQVLYTDTDTDDQTDEALFTSSIPLSSDQTPLIGIHRIYTLQKFRSQGIAHELLNVIIDSHIYGFNTKLLLEKFKGEHSKIIAFSQPTQAGRRLGEGWLKKKQKGSNSKDGVEQSPGLVVYQE
ncbi:unnamed protein product [Sympodiomycopsis kandeliae]